MPGIADKIHKSIQIELLSFITHDLQKKLNRLNECVKKVSLNEDSDRLIPQIKRFIDSSDAVCNNLTLWSASQLMGKPVYTSDLRLQTRVVINLIKDLVQNISLSNRVEDNVGLGFNLSLFRFVLRELLLFCIYNCKSDNIQISSVSTQKEIIISLSNISTELSNLSEALTQKGISIELENDTLMTCYTLLNLYGGNVWSECSLEDGTKLYFSIPVFRNTSE